MAIDVEQLTSQMLGAVRQVVGNRWPKLKGYATLEFAKIAQTIAYVERERLTGAITNEEAALLIGMQRNATRAVLAAVKGMTLILAEESINAAFDVVATVVNESLGVALL